MDNANGHLFRLAMTQIAGAAAPTLRAIKNTLEIDAVITVHAEVPKDVFLDLARRATSVDFADAGPSVAVCLARAIGRGEDDDGVLRLSDDDDGIAIRVIVSCAAEFSASDRAGVMVSRQAMAS